MLHDCLYLDHLFPCDQLEVKTDNGFHDTPPFHSFIISIQIICLSSLIEPKLQSRLPLADTQKGGYIRTTNTVLSDSSLWGDALSTAAFVLGTEEGLKLIEGLAGTEAVFIARDRGVTYSSGAEAYMIK